MFNLNDTFTLKTFCFSGSMYRLNGSSMFTRTDYFLCLDLKIRVCKLTKNSFFSAKSYVVGTQKNRLNETVLLSIQNI